MSTHRKAVIGLVASYSDAVECVHDLVAAGFSRDDISALFPDASTRTAAAMEHEASTAAGASVGVGLGTAIGGTVGLLAGIGALAIPGIGPFLAMGPILAALTGSALGGAVGGVAGALTGIGIPEAEAKAYEEKIKSGRFLVSVHVDTIEQQARAKAILQKDGAENVSALSEIAAQ